MDLIKTPQNVWLFAVSWGAVITEIPVKEVRDEMISVTDTKTKQTLGTIDSDSLTYDISR